MHAKIVIMDTLFKKHRILISQTNTDIVREIMKSVNWEKQLVSIRGSRGVGKTTLMRQVYQTEVWCECWRGAILPYGQHVLYQSHVDGSG